MNKEQLMSHPVIATFPGEKKSIVKACQDEDVMAILTKKGSIHLHFDGRWRCYQPSNFKDFIDFTMSGGKALALSKGGHLLMKYRVKDSSNFSHMEGLSGVTLVEIDSDCDQFLALDNNGVFYESRFGYTYTLYEMDWSSFDAVKPEDRTVTQILAKIYDQQYKAMVLTTAGKVFIAIIDEGMSGRQENQVGKLKIIQETLSDKKVVDIAAGQKLVFALTDSGEVFKWTKINFGKKPPETVDYKCHELPFRGIKFWTSKDADLLLIYLESGIFTSVCFSDSGEVLQKLIVSSSPAFDHFRNGGFSFSGCLYNAVNKWDAELKIMWVKKSLSVTDIKEGSDLLIEVNGKQIACHQNIVSAHCEFLGNWIKNENMKEKTDKNLKLCVNGFKYAAIKTIVNYIYTGELCFNSFDILLELIELTEMWLEKVLQKFFVGEAIQQLSAANVHLAREIADKLDLQDLKRECLSYSFTYPPLVIS